MAPHILDVSVESQLTPTTKTLDPSPMIPSKQPQTSNGINSPPPSPLQTKEPEATLDPSHESALNTLITRLSQNHTNPSLTTTPSHTLSIQDTPIPHPAPHEVLLHVRCTGICGSDLHLWRSGQIGPLRIARPCVLGHESAGIVLAVGSNVTTLKPGDRIAVEPGVPCHNCWVCRSGRYNLCENVRFCGVGTLGCEGTIRRFMSHDARYCHLIPETMSWGTAALLEPLAVVMHAIAECGGLIGLGRPVLVCGAGPIGLIALKAARASGAWPLVVTDVDEARLRFAANFVPGVLTKKVDGSKTEIENAEEIRKLFGGKGGRDVLTGIPDPDEYLAPQVVLECTGVESSVATAAYTTRRGGMLMVVGVGRSKMDNLPFMHLSLAEIKLNFINRYRDMWPAAINVLADRRVMDLDALVTHKFELERAVEAMQTCGDRGSGSVKVQIVDDCEIRV